MQPDRAPRPPMFPLATYSLLCGCFIVGTVNLGGELLGGWPGELVVAARLVAALVLVVVAGGVAEPVLVRFGHWLDWRCGRCPACRRRAERGGRDAA